MSYQTKRHAFRAHSELVEESSACNKFLIERALEEILQQVQDERRKY